MKAIVIFKGLAYILLVLFTITLTNRLQVTKFKASLTFTELDNSDLEIKKVFFPQLAIVPGQFLLKPLKTSCEWTILPIQFDFNTITCPTLKFLYLTHSPPFLA
jgi:hypothetical protein